MLYKVEITPLRSDLPIGREMCAEDIVTYFKRLSTGLD
jgi:hypothetical protein